MSLLRTSLLVSLLSSFFIPGAVAKDLRNHPGVGFNNQFGEFSALSVRYGLPTPDPLINIQAEIVLGFNADTDEDTDNGFFAGGRVLYTFVAEDNMNLYGAAGVGLTANEEGAAAKLLPGLGVEFFLFGLENLGFSAEWGIAIDLGKPTGVATFSGSPGVGLHYYF